LDTDAALSKNGAIKAALLLCMAGNIQYKMNGNGNKRKTHLYAISKCIMFLLRLLFLLKEKAAKSSSTDDNTAHPCTRLDLTLVVSFFRLLGLDAYTQSR